jgi:hypothetical protein
MRLTRESFAYFILIKTFASGIFIRIFWHRKGEEKNRIAGIRRFSFFSFGLVTFRTQGFLYWYPFKYISTHYERAIHRQQCQQIESKRSSRSLWLRNAKNMFWVSVALSFHPLLYQAFYWDLSLPSYLLPRVQRFSHGWVLHSCPKGLGTMVAIDSNSRAVFLVSPGRPTSVHAMVSRSGYEKARQVCKLCNSAHAVMRYMAG